MIAKLVILTRDWEKVFADNNNADFLRDASIMEANIRIGDELPRVSIFEWEIESVAGAQIFEECFDNFVAPDDYAFIVSFDNGLDKVRGNGLLEDAIELRKVIALTSNPVAAKTLL